MMRLAPCHQYVLATSMEWSDLLFTYLITSEIDFMTIIDVHYSHYLLFS